MRFIQKLNDFNTSHVTVYRGAMKVTTLTARHFNTSHVTVYLDGSYPLSVVFVISIHLMLLFIS